MVHTPPKASTEIVERMFGPQLRLALIACEGLEDGAFSPPPFPMHPPAKVSHLLPSEREVLLDPRTHARDDMHAEQIASMRLWRTQRAAWFRKASGNARGALWALQVLTSAEEGRARAVGAALEADPEYREPQLSEQELEVIRLIGRLEQILRDSWQLAHDATSEDIEERVKALGRYGW